MYDKIHQTIGFTIEVNFYEYYHYQYNAYLHWIFILFNKKLFKKQILKLYTCRARCFCLGHIFY